MSSRITYENKQALQNDESVARENKVTDLDMNEIKQVVNSHADDIENFENYDDTEINQKIDTLTALVQSMQVTTHRINITTDIKENTEYTLPCQYIVGSGDIEIFCNNELMIRAVENSWGNFAEVRSRWKHIEQS